MNTKPSVKTPEPIEFISDLLTKFETPDFTGFANWPNAHAGQMLRLGDFIAYQPLDKGSARRIYQVHEIFTMGDKDALYKCAVVWHDGKYRAQVSTIRHLTVRKCGGYYRVYTPVPKAPEPVQAVVQADGVMEGKSVEALRKRADLAEKRQSENNQCLKTITLQSQCQRELLVEIVKQNKELLAQNQELIELVKKAWG